MPRRSALPACLDGAIFTTDDARRCGVPPKRLRATDLIAPYRAVRAPAGEQLPFVAHCHAALSALSDEAFLSHFTAARLHGIPIPNRFALEDTIHVSVFRPHRAPRLRGITGHQSTAQSNVLPLPIESIPIESATRASAWAAAGVLRVSAPARAWCEIQQSLSILDAVIAGDHIVGRGGNDVTREGVELTTPDQFCSVAADYPSRVNLRRRRLALQHIRVGSESPQESVLRVILREAGAPSLLANAAVTDARGRPIARPDLRTERHDVIFEYEGDHHRVERNQWQRDIDRTRALESAGWSVIRVVSADLVEPGLWRFLNHVESTLRSRGWIGTLRDPNLAELWRSPRRPRSGFAGG